MKKLIMYFGKECPHCHVMLPLADKLAKEEKIKIIKLEVWHNNKNAAKMRKFRKLIEESCGGEFGVPTFIDEENRKVLEKMYWQEKKSIRDIAKEVGISKSSIFNTFKELKIRTRTRAIEYLSRNSSI